MHDTRRAILEAIADGPASEPTLAAEHDVSRAAVWEHVEALRANGFEIDRGPDGYRLVDGPDYGEPALEVGLEAPFAVEYHETIGSTNDRARELAASGAEDVVVVANEQTGGRGRLDREWSAPPGGVWLSVVCRPSIPPARAPLYTLAAAVATATAAREAGVDARIKWPNDVIVPADDGDDRKLAGILSEMAGESGRIEWIVVGVGVNANVDPDALPEGATSIMAERAPDGSAPGAAAARGSAGAGRLDGDRGGRSPGAVDRRTVVQRLLETFDRYRTDLDAVVPAWLDLAATVGRRVRVETADDVVEGEAVDLTAAGSLVVETGDEAVTVPAGDCEHLRPTR